MSKSPAYQLYPDKAKAGTDHLSNSAFRSYWFINWWMWLHGKNQYSMKNTTEMWEIATGRSDQVLESDREEIMNPDFPLFQKRGQTLIDNGLKKEAKKQKKRRKQAQDAAKLRWLKEKEACERNANAIRKACTPSPIPSVSLNKKDLSISFKKFWEAWPKRQKRVDAENAWQALKPDSALVERIVEDVKTKAASEDWTKDNRKYCPGPGPYLRGKRWEDEKPEPPQPPKPQTPSYLDTLEGDIQTEKEREDGARLIGDFLKKTWGEPDPGRRPNPRIKESKE